MDASQFDGLTRRLERAPTRRAVLRLLGGSLVTAGLLARRENAAARPSKTCLPLDSPCGPDDVCCNDHGQTVCSNAGVCISAKKKHPA
jgi:hypothetical protein